MVGGDLVQTLKQHNRSGYRNYKILNRRRKDYGEGKYEIKRKIKERKHYTCWGLLNNEAYHRLLKIKGRTKGFYFKRILFLNYGGGRKRVHKLNLEDKTLE